MRWRKRGRESDEIERERERESKNRPSIEFAIESLIFFLIMQTDGPVIVELTPYLLEKRRER
jgi:hypothetical protein